MRQVRRRPAPARPAVLAELYDNVAQIVELEQGLDVGALDPHHRKLEVRTVAWSRKGPTLKWTYGQSALVSMAAGYKQRSCDRVRRSLVVDGFALPSTPSA